MAANQKSSLVNQQHDEAIVVEAYAVTGNNADHDVPMAVATPMTDSSSASASPPQQLPAPTPGNPALRTFLTTNQWPIGLQDTFLRNLDKIPMRFFICDDSGSMMTSDGHRIVIMNPSGNQPGKKKFVSCSRWQELTTSLKFHAELANLASAPTEFRLLNGGPPIVIGDQARDSESKYQRLMKLFDGSPNGGTPLCYHIKEVVKKITTMAPTLRANGQKACVIIATDGESSDGDIATAMKPLKDLPCQVIVRLCTDEDRIVSYWNNIDSELELDMDVLDDLQGEAEEVDARNPWLTYGEPLHRLREFGISMKELDLLDEMTLAHAQITLFATVLLGGSVSNFPESDGPEFHEALAAKVQSVGKIWHPLYQRDEPWIDVSKLKPTAVGKKAKSSNNGGNSGESAVLTWQVPVAIVILLLIAYLMPHTKISLICIALSIILGTMRYYSAI